MKQIKIFLAPGGLSKTAVITNEDLNQKQAERVLEAISHARTWDIPSDCGAIWRSVRQNADETFPAWPTNDMPEEEGEKWSRFHEALNRYHKERGKLADLEKYYEARRRTVKKAKYLTAEEQALLTPEQKRFINGEYPSCLELSDDETSRLILEGI